MHDLQPTTDSHDDVEQRIADARISGVSYRPTRHRGPALVSLTVAARLPFEETAPIRQPMAYQGQWSKPGYYFMARTGVMVSYESRFEMAHLMLLDRDPDVQAVMPQPFRLHWAEPGSRARTHVPDFLVRRRNGTAEVLDVKGSRRAAQPENAFVFGLTARACAQMRMSYRVATDIDPVVLQNHRWLTGYRLAHHRIDELGPYVIDAVTPAGVVLADVVSNATKTSGEHPALIKAALFHLLWADLLWADLRAALSSRTVIRLDAEAASHVA